MIANDGVMLKPYIIDKIVDANGKVTLKNERTELGQIVKKETTDKKYHEDPFRAVNFPIDKEGIMRCPNGKAFYLKYRQSVKGNQYGRQEEVYECEDCVGCPFAERCKKTDKNRKVRINQELTAMHQEVVKNLESIQGA